MSKIPALIALVALTIPLAHAADWLSYGGDPQRTGWQKREKSLNAGNVHELKLLWERQLATGSKAVNSLTSPVLLGPIITHRGIKELVFVAGSSDNVYAVDADLGRLFWERHIDSAAEPDRKSKLPCGAGLTATPVIGPPQAATVNDDDGEGSTPLRPLYVLSSDGRLHTIRPSDGKDMAESVKFIPPNANAANLNLADESIYTVTSHNCGGAPDGIWAMPVNRPDAKAAFTPSRSTGDPASGGVSVGSDGAVYSASAGSMLTPIPFTWKGRKLIASAGKRGRVVLLNAADSKSVSNTSPLANDDARGLATWEDASGTRWIYAALRDSIAAFQVTGVEPTLMRVWAKNGLFATAPPVVANGVVFALASGGSTHATLYALDANTGRRLYSSGDAVTSETHSGLAIANGHVCFTTVDNTLYCFGIPIEI